MDWSLVLFGLKWVFLGLVYVVLVLLLVGVSREMHLRVPVASQEPVVNYGRLRVVQPGSDRRIQPGTLLTLKPETKLGAGRGSTILLRDQYISANHAALRWDGVSWWVEDLNSTNGTFVNQRKIAPGASEALPNGSLLQLGDMIFEMIEA